MTIQISRFTQEGETHRLQEIGLTDPAVAEHLHHWIADYCASWLGGTDWVVESPVLPLPLTPSQLSLLARSADESVAVVLVGDPVSVIELSGLIVGSAANLSGTAEPRSEVSRVLVLSSQVTKGLNAVQRFLCGHDIQVEALQTRMFRDANGDSVIVTHCSEPDHETVNHNRYVIDNKLEVFGDPVQAIVHNVAKETNGA